MSESIVKKNTNETVKQKLLNALEEEDGVEQTGLNEIAKQTNKYIP